MRDEKVHAVVARSTFTRHTMLGPLLEVEMSKSARRCGVKHILEVKMLKTPHVPTTFGRSDVVLRGRRKGLWTVSKVSKT